MCRFRGWVFAAVVAVLLLGFVVQMGGRVSDSETVETVPGGTAFTLELYRGVAAEHEGENIFISPFSVRSALAMTWEGARGRTADEMAAALRLPETDRPSIHAGFGSMSRHLNDEGKPYAFNVANALWLEQTFPFVESYLQQITTAYGAGLNQADFIHHPKVERSAINHWVEKQSDEKIKDLMPEDTIKDTTRLVLVNAVYFKGQWAEKFDPELTRDGAFRLIDGTQVQVPMMQRMNAKVLQGSGERFVAIELPYVGDELAMLILLPGYGKTVLDLESQLTPGALDAVLENMHEHELTVFTMPRFKIETESYRLNDALKSMGMERAFEQGGADFTGLSPLGRQLFISDVMHKGYVGVNEEGTEAAAATGVGVRATFASSLMVDRPFLFMIRHRPTGEVLFFGRVMDPRRP